VLNVKCQSCNLQFDVPLHTTGKIEYANCKNVFRVSYRFRTPCPQCKEVLLLSPAGHHLAIGTPLHVKHDEETEVFLSRELPTEGNSTLPQKSTAQKPTRTPQIRIANKTGKKLPLQVQDHTIVRPFRYINQAGKRLSPVHVPIQKRKKSFPILKIFLSLAMLLGTAGTIVLVTLALDEQTKKPKLDIQKSFSDPSLPSLHDPTPNVGTTDEPLTPTGNDDEPRGGPEEVLDIIADSDKKVVTTPLEGEKSSKGKKPTMMKLPELEKVTSVFGVRLDPFHQDLAFHGGVDFKAEYRAEIKAALDGKVRFAKKEGSYGNLVIIDHQDGYETRYAHLAKVLVKKGKKVKQGDLIGLAGSTGRSTGTHLHFELRKDGKRVDPLRAKLISRKS